MAKALDFSWDLPHTPDAMFQQVLQPGYIEALAKALDHYDLEIVALENGDEGGKLTTTYMIEVDLPSWAKKMFAPRNKVTETRVWGPAAADGAISYTFLVRIDNVPVEIRGKVEVLPKGGDVSLNTVHLDIKASLPIIGGKLEELVAKDLVKNVEGERDFVLSWMKTHS